MSDDLDLANGILAANKRAVRTFTRRFGHAVEHAFEHCRDAREFGLELAEYADACGIDAAKSLLAALPRQPSDALLDPHVTRILGFRDYALGLLLRRGQVGAWGRFREKFGPYLRSLLMRAGTTPWALDDAVDQVIAELSNAALPAGEAPIAEYVGRADLSLWLFVYLRRRFHGGLDIGAVGSADGHDAVAQPGFSDDLSGVAESAITAAVDSLSPKDRLVLTSIVVGCSLRTLATSAMLPDKPQSLHSLLDRHETIVDQMHDALGAALGQAEAVDRREWQQRALDHLNAELARICGYEVR